MSYRRETICLALSGEPNQIKCLEHIIKSSMVRHNQRPQACKSGKGPITGAGLDGSDTMDVNSLPTPLLYKAYTLSECHLQLVELLWLHYEDYDPGTNSTSTDSASFSKLHLGNTSLEDLHSSSSLSHFLLENCVTHVQQLLAISLKSVSLDLCKSVMQFHGFTDIYRLSKSNQVYSESKITSSFCLGGKAAQLWRPLSVN